MNKSLKADLNEYARTVKGAEMVDDSHFYDFRQNIYGGEMPPQIRKCFWREMAMNWFQKHVLSIPLQC